MEFSYSKCPETAWFPGEIRLPDPADPEGFEGSQQSAW